MGANRGRRGEGWRTDACGIQKIKISWSWVFKAIYLVWFFSHQVILSDCIYTAIHLNVRCMCVLSLLHSRILGGWKDSRSWENQSKKTSKRTETYRENQYLAVYRCTQTMYLRSWVAGFQSSETTENNTAWSFNCDQKLPIVTNPSIKVEIQQGHIFVKVNA